MLQVTNRGTKIYVTCRYPEKNPPEIEKEIAACLGYLGVFSDDILNK